MRKKGFDVYFSLGLLVHAMPWIITRTLSLLSLKCFRGVYSLLSFSAKHIGLGSKGYLQLLSLVHSTAQPSKSHQAPYTKPLTCALF